MQMPLISWTMHSASIISEHNPVDQALIYLGSPYWQLAAFSLVLAFFLDIAAFITGLVIDVADRRKMLEK